MTDLSKGIGQLPSGRAVRMVKASMNRKNDMEETPDYLNSQVKAGVAAKEMETDKINPAAENLLQGEQAGVESAEIDSESKGQTFGSRIGRHQSLAAILATLAAVSLVSLFFFAISVASFFSGARKSMSRRRRK
jgi:hypothetical protein